MTSVFEKSQQGLFSNPNLLHNTCVRMNQRGQETYSSTGWAFDQIFLQLSAGVGTLSREANNYTTHPFKAPYCTVFDVTTGDDWEMVRFPCGDSRRFRSNQTLTVSFWYQLTGKSIDLRYNATDSAGGVGDGIATIEVSSAWQFASHTFTLKNWSGSAYDPDDYLMIQFGQSTATDTNPFHLRIADLKLEFGSVATPWVMEEEDDNEMNCYRHYFVSEMVYYNSMTYNNSTVQTERLTLPVQMRKTPTITYVNPSHITTSGNWGVYGTTNGWSGPGYSPITYQWVRNHSFCVRFEGVVGSADWENHLINGSYIADAELPL